MGTIKLPPDFEINKYGLRCRLVQEEDAGFIVRLRTDPVLSRYIHDTSADIMDQIRWIRQYKKREANGEDYYFIFYFADEPVGVDRIYNINQTSFSFGSWVFLRGVPFWVPIAGAIIGREIAFETLGKQEEQEVDGTNERNSGVLSFSRQLGMKFTGNRIEEKGVYLTGVLYREDFEKNKQRFIDKIVKMP
jgi:hypothetical protein